MYNKLSVRDQARLYSVTSTFDTRAYNAVKTLKSAHTDELFVWLSSPAAKKMPVEQQASYAKDHFGISDPEVFDATMTYIGYQLRSAYLVDHQYIRPEFLVIHGWASPIVDVQPWARASVQGVVRQGSMVGPTHMANALGQLLRGQVPADPSVLTGFKNTQHRSDGSWTIDGKTVAVVLVGFAAAALFTWATAGVGVVAFAMVESALAAAVGETLAGVLAFMIVGAGMGAGSEVASGIATRLTEWLLGDREFDDVFDPKMVGHDAIVGGIFGLVTGALSSQLQRLFSDLGKATRNANRAKKALATIKARYPHDRMRIAMFTDQLEEAEQQVVKAKRAHDLAVAARRRIVAEAQNEIGAVKPGSWLRAVSGELEELTLANRLSIDNQIRARLKKLGFSDPAAFDAVVASGNVPVGYLDDARIALRELMRTNIDDAGFGKLMHNLTTCTPQQFRSYVAEANASLAEWLGGLKTGSRIVMSHDLTTGKADLLTELVDMSPIPDADVVTVQANGIVRATEVKVDMHAVDGRIKEFLVKKGTADKSQLERLSDWLRNNPGGREVIIHVDSPDEWFKLFLDLDGTTSRRIDQLASLGFGVRSGDVFVSAKKLKELALAIRNFKGNNVEIAKFGSLVTFAKFLGVEL